MTPRAREKWYIRHPFEIIDEERLIYKSFIRILLCRLLLIPDGEELKKRRESALTEGLTFQDDRTSKLSGLRPWTTACTAITCRSELGQLDLLEVRVSPSARFTRASHIDCLHSFGCWRKGDAIDNNHTFQDWPVASVSSFCAVRKVLIKPELRGPSQVCTPVRLHSILWWLFCHYWWCGHIEASYTVSCHSFDRGWMTGTGVLKKPMMLMIEVKVDLSFPFPMSFWMSSALSSVTNFYPQTTQSRGSEQRVVDYSTLNERKQSCLARA